MNITTVFVPMYIITSFYYSHKIPPKTFQKPYTFSLQHNHTIYDNDFSIIFHHME